MEVRNYRGGHGDALANIKFGEFRIDGMTKAPSGNPVIPDLALDRDGILQVPARERNTGLERLIAIDKAVSRDGREQMDEARQRIGALFADPDPGTSAAAAAIDASLQKAGARLDAAGEEDHAEIIELIEAIKDATGSGDRATLEAARGQLQHLLFHLKT